MFGNTYNQDMSQVYVSEPATNGKVVLHTSVGDIDVELWSKEAPLACRNFIQLSLEGYYNGCVFHRIVKGFVAQTGDPTRTGSGGESVFGGPFKDEFHSRLTFSRRGIVAMANSGAHTNLSQFFITLDACPWLQKKNSIFGKVTGPTIYNVDKFKDCETDSEDRPAHPPKILSVSVVNNPFDDIVPRQGAVQPDAASKTAAVEKRKKGKGKASSRNLKLLSFGDEQEDMEAELHSSVPLKKLSSHDALADPMRSKASSVEDTVSVAPAARGDRDVVEEEDRAEKDQTVTRRRSRIQQLTDELFGGSASKAHTLLKDKGDEIYSPLEQRRRLFLKKKKNVKEREADTLAKLAAFEATLVKAAQGASGGSSAVERDDDDEEDREDGSWMTHKVKFMKRPQDFDASSRGAEGDYTVIDPRLKPLKKKHKTNTYTHNT